MSGAFGALLATIIAAGISFWRERIRLKADVFLTVVGWADDTYLRLIDLRAQKRSVYREDKAFLTEQEYAINSRILRELLLKASVSAQLALAYGEGKEIALINELRENLTNASTMLWRSNRENWDTIDAQVEELFVKKIDPARSSLERELLVKASMPMILLGLKKRLSDGPTWGAVK